MPNKPKCDLFVSYADADRQWVNGYLLNAMDQAGVQYQSEADFRLGAPQVTEFERLIGESKRTLLVVSPNYLADDFDEYGQVLATSFGVDKGEWPVIPVTREDVEMPTRLEMLAGLDFTNKNKPNWSAELERLVKNVKGKVPDLDPGKLPPCPYPGMVPFTEKDRERFFGREDDAEAALHCLADHPLLTVIGPSGSGKSSLVFAGLIPALRESKTFGTGTWLVRSMRPGETPLLTLTSTLGADPAQPQETVAAALKSKRGAKRLLLVIDQFEESYTVAKTEEVAPFHLALGDLAKVSGCYVVLTVRADFYSELMTSSLWSEISDHRLEVLPLGEHGLREAITKPAEEAKVKVYVEGALVERLVVDAAGEPGVLPLMQETLRLLWTKLDRRFLSLDTYEALVGPRSARGTGGAPPRTGLQVAMARKADSALKDLPVEQRTIARRIFLRLIQFTDGRADTRRQQPEAALRAAGEDPGLFDATLHHLVDWRLLTVSGDERRAHVDAEQANGGRRVDIAHEALISGWPQLQQWLTERREAEQTRRRLEAKTEEWVHLGRGHGGLLDAAELPEAERWLEGMDASELGVSEALLALVDASRAAIEAVERKQEESRLRELDLAEAARREAEHRVAEQAVATRGLRQWLLIAFGLGAVALLTAIGAIAARVEAEEQAQVNLIQALAAEALNHDTDGESELGALLARQAYVFEAQANTPISRPVDAALRQTLQVPRFRRDLRGHLGVIRSVAFSPAGDQLVSSDQAGTVLLRDPNNPTAVPSPLGNYDGPVYAVGFAPGGDKVAVGRDDGSIVVFAPDAPTIAPITRRGDGTAVNALLFVSDNLLAAASANGIIRLWDLDQDDADPQRLIGHQGSVRALAFAPADNRLASAGEDGIIHLWDLDPSSVTVATLNRHEHTVRSLAFTPKGDRLASGDEGGTILIWNPDQPRDPPVPLKDQEGWVNAVAFAPGGNVLASAGKDGTIRLWDSNALTNEPLTIEVNPENPAEIWTLAFTPERDVLASGGEDQVIHLWNLNEAGATPEIVQEDAGEVHGMAFLQPDKRLAVGSVDGTVGTVRLWDLTQPDVEPKALRGNAGEIQALAFAPTRNWLASGSAGGPLLLWDLNELDPEPRSLSLPEGNFWAFSVAFSPTGDWLASGSADDRIWLWDLNHLDARPQSLTGHSGWVGSVAFDPVSNRLASAGQDGEILLWDLEKPGMPATSVGTHGRQIQAVAFAPTGDLLASAGSDGSIKLWNLAQPEVAVSTLLGGANPVLSLAFASTGDWLASGSADGTVRLWNFRKPEEDPIVLGSHEQDAFAVSFAPDGATLASGGRDQSVRMWTVSTSTLADLVCDRVWRNLTEEEWSKHVGDEIPRESTCPGLPPFGENEGPDVALVHDAASST